MARLIRKEDVARQLKITQQTIYGKKLSILSQRGNKAEFNNLMEEIVDFTLGFIDNSFLYPVELSWDRNSIYVRVGDVLFVDRLYSE